MAEKTGDAIKESLLKQFMKDYPNEKLYGKVFSIYILNRHVRLLYRIYKKAGK